MKTRVEWEFDQFDDPTGRFAVISGALASVPEGWRQIHPGIFSPELEPCRFRRLSTRLRGDVVEIPIRCTIPGFGEVTHNTCASCPMVDPGVSDESKIQFLQDHIPSSRTEEQVEQSEELADLLEAVRLTWEPCSHREIVKESGGCCPKLVCRCPSCPLVDQQLIRSNCKDCEWREE